MKGIKDALAIFTFVATALTVHVMQIQSSTDPGFDSVPVVEATAEPMACDEAVTSVVPDAAAEDLL